MITVPFYILQQNIKKKNLLISQSGNNAQHFMTLNEIGIALLQTHKSVDPSHIIHCRKLESTTLRWPPMAKYL
jgi:hypothetical protein